MRACSLRYSASIAHASYCHLWPDQLYYIFTHYLINGTIFKRTSLNTKCGFWYSLRLLSETFTILRRIQRDWSKMYTGLHVKYQLFLSDFKETSVFSSHFRRIVKYQISPKSVQRDLNCSMRMDGHTGRHTLTKLTVAFRNFANAPKNPQMIKVLINGRYNIICH